MLKQSWVVNLVGRVVYVFWGLVVILIDLSIDTKTTCLTCIYPLVVLVESENIARRAASWLQKGKLPYPNTYRLEHNMGVETKILICIRFFYIF